MDPVREIETYRLILAGKFGTATCYATGIHPGEQRYWLLLEAVRGVELYQIGDIEIWRSVARWLAELHAWGSTVYAATATAAHLLDHTASFYRRWMQRALTHAPRGTQLAAMRWLADRHERVIEQIVALPKTFIHGECYASNVLVQARPTLRVCPIDWEMAALGPGLMDLAALSSGTWTLAERDVIAEAYCQTLRRIDSGSLGARDFSAALDCCRFQLAVQWLGWSTGWQPPPQHATNWLGEALSAADRLGL